MNKSFRRSSQRHREGLIGAISAGFFLILAGMIFVATPSFLDNLNVFFHDFNITQVPNTEIYLPAPKNPPTNLQANLAAYSTLEQFSIIWGIFLVAILAARFVVHSRLRRKAQNLSDIVFWFGTAYLTQILLIERTEWFVFWTGIITLAGVSLIIRAVFLATARLSSRHFDSIQSGT